MKLQDYCQDVQEWLPSFFYAKFVREMLNTIVLSYVMTIRRNSVIVIRLLLQYDSLTTAVWFTYHCSMIRLPLQYVSLASAIWFTYHSNIDRLLHDYLMILWRQETVEGQQLSTRAMYQFADQQAAAKRVRADKEAIAGFFQSQVDVLLRGGVQEW